MIHRVFQREEGQTSDVHDRLEDLKDATLPELQAIAADPDMQLTVRKAAERTIRKIRRMLTRRES
jgi:hypothetical protein